MNKTKKTEEIGEKEIYIVWNDNNNCQEIYDDVDKALQVTKHKPDYITPIDINTILMCTSIYNPSIVDHIYVEDETIKDYIIKHFED